MEMNRVQIQKLESGHSPEVFPGTFLSLSKREKQLANDINLWLGIGLAFFTFISGSHHGMQPEACGDYAALSGRQCFFDSLFPQPL